MRKPLIILVLSFFLSLVGYAVPITEFDFYIPPNGMIITEECITYVHGSDFYDIEGESYDTGNHYTFTEFHSRAWVGIADIMAIGLDLPYVQRKRSGPTGERKGKGIGDLTLTMRFGSPKFAFDFGWTIPTGKSQVKEALGENEYGTGGTLYTPWGGTHNLNFYGYFKGKLIRGYIGYVLTFGREYQDSTYNFNPGDSFRYGLSIGTMIGNDMMIGALLEGFQTGLNKYDGEDIPGSEVERLDFTPYIAVDLLDGTIVYIGYTMVNSGKNVQAIDEWRFGINVLEF